MDTDVCGTSNYIVIVMTILNMLLSLGKQFLNNKKQNEIKNVISLLTSTSVNDKLETSPIAITEEAQSPTERVQLTFPDHLKGSVVKDPSNSHPASVNHPRELGETSELYKPIPQ
jgi:hypothetical protein